MSRRDTPDMAAVRSLVLRWYRRHGRDLPWRKTSDPYRILVSELMLQQTQVPRVLLKYREFLKLFPTLDSLSKATPGRVIGAWQGLGYNRRALWLHQIARRSVSEGNGKLPDTYERLRSLPGIGDYTARALLTFAFQQQEPVLDVNIRRVIGRIVRTPAKNISIDDARSFLPRGRAYEWNQALMDIGSLYCTARRPDCSDCPIRRVCSSAGRVAPPGKKPARKEPGRYGIPRRIYRGRILKELARRSPLRAAALATSIGLRDTRTDLQWLTTIVEALHAEGLVKRETGPSPWRVRRVT